MRWDIFCKVIDNHGDIGVCWRLAADLATRGDTVRLWIDDADALAWMAPQGHPDVQVLPWPAGAQAEPGDAVVEAFGCELEPGFIDAIARRTRQLGRQPPWINLEYLSAEGWVERCHGLPSPVQVGPGKGLVKRFFYPGFTPATGGLLRERDLLARQASFDRVQWLRGRGIPFSGERLVSLFCYEPPGLPALLAQLARDSVATRLLVTAGRAHDAVRALLSQGLQSGRLAIDWLPLLPHAEFDHLLWSCDMNFVRGEDSLVRALWAGRPLVWNIYPQPDGAHRAKLQAFLDWLQPLPAQRAWHEAWNEAGTPWPGALEAARWQDCAVAAKDRLLDQQDLASQLQSFVQAA